MPSISILGCGWLGLPLAKRLIQEGFDVKGSTTTPAKIQELETLKIQPYLIDYQAHQEHDTLDFYRSEILFINIPFRRDLKDPKSYFDQIKAVINDAKKGGIQAVIFAGSTSIYPDEVAFAREEDELSLRDARAKTLQNIEFFLLNQDAFQTCILRFGGLIGGSRQLGRFLAEKKQLKNAARAVNLIHLDDCIEIVLKIIEKKAYGEIFNAVSDKHPTRGELYREAALRMKLSPPEFIDEEVAAASKIVINDKLKNTLGYQFIHPDPFDFD